MINYCKKCGMDLTWRVECNGTDKCCKWVVMR
jgi:hypothetical protein